MSFLTTNDGTTLFYNDWGQGKPVVFVHAWGMNSTFWQYTMIYFRAQGLRCIACDSRGHGRSDDPGYGYDFDTLADDLHCLLEKLDLQDVTLVGHSMGGGVVLRCFSRHGSSGRISRLALLGAADYLPKAGDNPEGIDMSQLNNFLATISTNYLGWLYENIDPFYLPGTFGVSAGTIRWTIDMMLQTSMLAVVDCQQQVITTDFRPEACGITIPTLIIHGDKDASIPFRCGQTFHKLITGSIFKPYRGAPHGLIISHADQVNKDLYDFIGTS